MATSAAARDAVCTLRRQIASIEGRLPETFSAATAEAGPMAGAAVMRCDGRVAAPQGVLATGVAGLDAALGGGVPGAGLTEIHGRETRDAGSVAGFALALLARHEPVRVPILWIGTSDIFRESGLPYALALKTLFGIEPQHLLLSRTRHLSDALWIAEEAAGLRAIAVILLEIRGNPAKLDLTATRRLHRRAEIAGRPIFLLRQAAEAEPTAAPVRLIVAPAEAGLRATLAGPLPRSIGPPGFHVTLSKSRTASPGQFTLEWNADERTFHDRKPADAVHDMQNGAERGPAHPGAVFSLSRA